MGIYTVQEGDTLTALARRFRGDPNAWRDYQKINQLRNPNRLKIGQTLEIPEYQAEDMAIPDPRPDPRKGMGPGAGPTMGQELPQRPSPELVGMSQRQAPLSNEPSPELFSQGYADTARANDTAWAADAAKHAEFHAHRKSLADTTAELTQEAAIPENLTGTITRNPKTDYPQVPKEPGEELANSILQQIPDLPNLAESQRQKFGTFMRAWFKNPTLIDDVATYLGFENTQPTGPGV